MEERKKVELMKANNPSFFSFSKLRCRLFGHFFHVSRRITDHLKEYTCAHCGLEMTDTANGFWAKLTPKFRETNEYIRKIHQRRKKRLFGKAS